MQGKPFATLKCRCCSGSLKGRLCVNQQLTAFGVELGLARSRSHTYAQVMEPFRDTNDQSSQRKLLTLDLRKPAPDPQLTLLWWSFEAVPKGINHLQRFASNSGALKCRDF